MLADRLSTTRQVAGQHIVLLVLFLMCGTLTGCGLFQKVGLAEPTPPEEQSYTLKLKLSASADVNPNNQGRPSPVLVRIFMTGAGTEINDSTFEKVFDLENQTMDPRPMQSFTIRPGEVKDLTLQLNRAQTRLMIAAAYRDPYQAIWKTGAIISPQATVSASAILAKSAVSIEASLR